MLFNSGCSIFFFNIVNKAEWALFIADRSSFSAHIKRSVSVGDVRGKLNDRAARFLWNNRRRKNIFYVWCGVNCFWKFSGLTAVLNYIIRTADSERSSPSPDVSFDIRTNYRQAIHVHRARLYPKAIVYMYILYIACLKSLLPFSLSTLHLFTATGRPGRIQ